MAQHVSRNVFFTGRLFWKFVPPNMLRVFFTGRLFWKVVHIL